VSLYVTLSLAEVA